MTRTLKPGIGDHRKRDRLTLRLYVAGHSPNSALARANLQAAISHLPQDEVSVEIIDVLLDPSQGAKDRVLVTPTLVKVTPAPVQRVVGSLRDVGVLLTILGIVPPGAAGAP